MNDINLLMKRIAEINHIPPTDLTGKDVDDMVAFHRARREMLARGIKPDRQHPDKLSAKDILGIMGKAPSKPTPKIKFDLDI
jgi:hypothetical protein